MEGKNKPKITYKAGGVKASVFENKAEYNGKETTMYRVAIDKTYKDSNGNWQSTNSFNATTELNKAITVLQKANEFCMKLEEKRNGENNETGNEIKEEYIE